MNNSVESQNASKPILTKGAAVGLIVVVAGLLVVNVIVENGHSRSRARKVGCRFTLKQIGVALSLYSEVAKNLGRYPVYLEDLYPEIITDERILICPYVESGDHKKGRGLVTFCDYYYLPNQSSGPKDAIVAFGPMNSDGLGRNVLRRDGSVSWNVDANFNANVVAQIKSNGGSLDLNQNATFKDLEKLKALRREIGLD